MNPNGKSGFFQLANDAVEISREHGPNAFAVFCYLGILADLSGECWPSQQTIAEKLGVSLSTVERALRQLKAAGILSIHRRKQMPAIYRLERYARPVTHDGSKAQDPSNLTPRPVKSEAQDPSNPDFSLLSTKTQKDKDPDYKDGPSADGFSLSSNGSNSGATFDDFWRVFPSGRKSGKQSARKAWDKALKEHGKSIAATIVAKAAEYADSPKGQGDYVQMPATWLNAGCWEDHPDAWNERHVSARTQINASAVEEFVDDERIR